MLFSIIVPIYNVSHHIARGFESLNCQTFKDFEIIFINDGSTDDSLKQLRYLEHKHDFVHVFSQPNAGSGPARNLGIQHAHGDYIVFFDIDDIMHERCLEKIENTIKRTNPELVVFGYREIDITYKSKIEYPFSKAFYGHNAAFRQDFVTKFSGLNFNNGFVWNKAYGRQFLIKNHIEFEPLLIQQDEVFNHAVYPCVRKVAVMKEILYDYYVYNSGNTRSRYIAERFDIYLRVRQSFLNLCSRWGLDDKEFFIYIHKRFVESAITYIGSNIGRDTKKRESALKSLFRTPPLKESATFLINTPKEYIKFPLSAYINAIYADKAVRFLMIHDCMTLVSYIKKKIRQII